MFRHISTVNSQGCYKCWGQDMKNLWTKLFLRYTLYLCTETGMSFQIWCK